MGIKINILNKNMIFWAQNINISIKKTGDFVCVFKKFLISFYGRPLWLFVRVLKET